MGNYDLYQKAANKSGSEEVLLQSTDNKRPNSWSPDGRFILYDSSLNNGDLMLLPLTADRKPFPFLSTLFNEQQGAFSPNGKWVAYQSNESGRFEIYVRAFPGPGGEWQASTEGGLSPRWRADSKELYYLSPDARLMAVGATEQGGTFRAWGAQGAVSNPHCPAREQTAIRRRERGPVSDQHRIGGRPRSQSTCC